MDSDPPSDRELSVPSGERNHQLAAVDAWLPGAEPTDYDIALSADNEHRTRYWRCTACGQERDRRDAFTARCQAAGTTEVAVDGGYAVDDERTRRAMAADLTVRFLAFGSHYAVEDDGTRYVVDVDAETCSCDADPGNAPCLHLRRADLAIRTGELPGPDGRYAR